MSSIGISGTDPQSAKTGGKERLFRNEIIVQLATTNSLHYRFRDFEEWCALVDCTKNTLQRVVSNE